MRRVLNQGRRASEKLLPFSDGVVAEGTLLFTSGKVGWDLETGDLPDGIGAQTDQCLRNLEVLLKTAGSSFENVLKVTVYLTDADDYDPMNEVYGQYFPGNPPARTTVVVDLVRPELLVEIDLIALVPDGRSG